MNNPDLLSEVEVARFTIAKSGGKITLDCVVTYRWENVFTLNLECGTKQEHALTCKKGIIRTERQSLETTMKGSVGFGIANFESEVKAHLEGELQFEESSEIENRFSFEAPKCGRRTVALYQRVRIYHLAYRDRRWLHQDSWSRRFIEWLPNIHDDSKQSLNDPKCGCKPDVQDGVDGVLLVTCKNFSLLEGYKRTLDHRIFLNTLKQTVPSNLIERAISGAPQALIRPVLRDSIPPHLLFLSGSRDQQFLMQLGRYVFPERFNSALSGQMESEALPMGKEIFERLDRIEYALIEMKEPMETSEARTVPRGWRKKWAKVAESGESADPGKYKVGL